MKGILHENSQSFGGSGFVIFGTLFWGFSVVIFSCFLFRFSFFVVVFGIWGDPLPV